MKKQSTIGVLGGVMTAVLITIFAWIIIANTVYMEPTQLLADTNPPQQVDVISAFGGLPPYVIPAAAFSDDGNTLNDTFFLFAGGYIEGNGSDGCVKAPVYLPENVMITEMYASVFDNEPGDAIYVNLRRLDNFSGATTLLANAFTTSDFNGIQVINDITIDNPQTAFPNYSYYVTTCLSSGSTKLYSVRIYYNFQIYLPMIVR